MADWGYAPTVLIFGDTEEGRAAATASVMHNGGRIAATLSVEQAVDRLDSQVAVDLVILDITIDHGPLLDRLFCRIEDGAAARQFAGVVVIPPALVDAAAARISNQDVDLQVGRDDETLNRALAERLRRAQTQLREPPPQGWEPARLRYPSETMDAHQRSPDAPAEGQHYSSSSAEAGDGPGSANFEDAGTDAAAIRSIIRARRLRGEFFGTGLFADPAWDILLDLSAARLEGRSVAVSSLCIAAAVPATTALRWIKQLTEAGLLRRVADPVDGRRVFIELTDSAARTMMAYFAAASRGGRI